MRINRWLGLVAMFTVQPAFPAPHGPVPDVAHWGTGNAVAHVALPSGGVATTAAASITRDGNLLIGGSITTASEQMAVVRLLKNGTVDSDFGNGGLLLFSSPAAGAEILDLAANSDGSIAFIGESVFGSSDKAWVGRFTADGAPDPTFNSTGYQLVYATTFLNALALLVPTQVAIQPDGKIVALSTLATQVPSTTFCAAMIRFDQAGAADSTFGTDGEACYTLADGTPFFFAHFAVRPNGKIVVTGPAYLEHGLGSDIAVVQLNSNGSIDTTFGNSGWTFVALDLGGNFIDVSNAVTIDAAGRTLIAGSAEDDTIDQLALIRLLPNGAPDLSFGDHGHVTMPIDDSSGAPGSTTPTDVIAFADGRILVGGSVTNTGLAVMFRDDGTLDPQFGNAGLFLQSNSTTSAPNTVNVAHLSIDGDLMYMVGTSTNPTTSAGDFAAARFVLPLFKDGFDGN